jgi:hydroxyacyl-ACP dehydratase HTD2-like protein with hotdog domain
MNNQNFFEDVVEGQEIAPLEKTVTTVNILMYLSTVWLMDRIHFDYPFATQRRGLPNVVAPGNMAGDYYAELLSRWAGEKGELRKLSIQFRNFMLPGDILVCGGKIINKYIDERKGYVELELWLRNQNNVNCVPGKGVVELPIKEVENQ